MSISVVVVDVVVVVVVVIIIGGWIESSALYFWHFWPSTAV